MNIEGYERYVGQVFDNRYRLLKTLGVGGMSVVFEAYDLLEKRTVALKMLRDDIASDAQQVKRFVNESRAVAMLSHPNIVKIYNISFKSVRKFIVMEYIEGITLKEYMTKRGVLSFSEIISYTEQILHALEHAHSRGVIHRDIKPQNIMLLKNGVIKVTDFGIAKIPNAETMTLTDKAIGTVYYISPEQAEGKAINQRSDLYSLGVMIYEMSCGRLPFYDESPISVALKQINDDPVPPRSINPSIPRGLEQIILSAMEKDPDLRFQSATQMLRQLARLKADPNIVFKPSPKLESAHKKAEKTKNVSGAKKKRTESKNSSMFPIILGVVSAFFVVLIVSAFVLLKAFFAGDSSIITLTVPNVLGYTYTTQDALGLSSTYYTVELEEKYDANSQKGQILKQYPAGGQKVKVSAEKQKQVIKLTVSLGAETVILENYEDKSAVAVKNSLQNLGFIAHIESVYSDTVAIGKVCYTYPAAGETAVVGSTVIIYESIGRASGADTVEIPKFIGLSETEARRLAAERSLVISNVEYKPSDEALGIVIDQSSPEGFIVKPNSEVILIVSGGKGDGDIGDVNDPISYVPNITGLTVEEADKRLNEQGLRVGNIYEEASDERAGIIIRQTPTWRDLISSLDSPEIEVYISSGPKEDEPVYQFVQIGGWLVPDVVGMKLKDARGILEKENFFLGDATVVESDLPDGTIVEIDLHEDDERNPFIDYKISGDPN